MAIQRGRNLRLPCKRWTVKFDCCIPLQPSLTSGLRSMPHFIQVPLIVVSIIDTSHRSECDI